MNKLLLALAICLGLNACGNNGTKKKITLQMWNKPNCKRQKIVWKSCIFMGNSVVLPVWR